MRHRATHIGLASLLFLASGFAALVYQVIWQRVLGIFSGAHIYSITLIVTAFMAGLGFGSLVGGKIADRLSRRGAVAGFALCELFIGLFALASPWLYYDVAYLKLGFLVRYPLLLPLAHFLLLLVPTFLMGASLPLLSRGLVSNLSRAARTIGILYGVNALGAALGAFASAWYLIGALGFVGTIRLGAALNLAACAGAWLLRAGLPASEAGDGRASGQTAEGESPSGDLASSETAEGEAASNGSAAGAPVSSVPRSGDTGRVRGLPAWAMLYAASGFIALSLEILWFRVLDTAIKSSPYSFGHLLGTFLLFLALGSLAGSLVVDRAKHPTRIFLWGQWAISLSAGVALLAVQRTPAGAGLLQGLLDYWSSDSGIEMHQIAAAWQQWRAGGDLGLLSQVAQIYGVLPLLLLALPTFLMGFTYAFIQRAVQTDPLVLGWRVGVIQAANIVGSMLGSFLTGAIFLTALGTPLTLRLLVLVGAGFGLLAVREMPRRRWATAILALLPAAIVAAALPGHQAFWARLHGSAVDDVVVVEDASSIVAMQRGGAAEQTVLRVNGTGMSLMPYGGVWSVLGLVPPLMQDDPGSILLIGLGAGNTAWAAAAVPEVRRIDLYEIAKPEIDVLIGAQRAWFNDPAVDLLLADPRLHMTFSDGRLAMRLEDRRYDLIEADALEPYMAYSGNLYSKEFFELARRSLNPGGRVCTYTPTQRVRRTVVSVFPYVLSVDSAVAQFMLGSDSPIDFEPERIRAGLARPEVQEYLERSGLAERTARDIELFLLTARVVRMTPEDRGPWAVGDVNSDLFPRDEYAKRHQR